MREVLSKVVLGEADAGFVYATDAKTVKGKVGVIGLPKSAQPRVLYAAAAVKSSKHLQAAKTWIRQLLTGERRRSCARRGSCQFRADPARARSRRRVRGHGRRARVPPPADRRDLRPRLAGRARRAALAPGRDRRARRQPEDERDRAGARAPPRYADRVPPGDAPLSGTFVHGGARRAAARPAARGRGDRPDRGLRPLRAARRATERVRDPARADPGRRRHRRRVRLEPALHPPGDRHVRGRRPEPRRRLAHARRGPGQDVLPRRPSPLPPRPCRRRGARVRARARRVRGHDHVRGQPRRA